jgi:hypothetical protein
MSRLCQHYPIPDSLLHAIRQAVQRSSQDCPSPDNVYVALGQAEAHREALLCEVERLRSLLTPQ